MKKKFLALLIASLLLVSCSDKKEDLKSKTEKTTETTTNKQEEIKKEMWITKVLKYKKDYKI